MMPGLPRLRPSGAASSPLAIDAAEDDSPYISVSPAAAGHTTPDPGTDTQIPGSDPGNLSVDSGMPVVNGRKDTATIPDSISNAESSFSAKSVVSANARAKRKRHHDADEVHSKPATGCAGPANPSKRSQSVHPSKGFSFTSDRVDSLEKDMFFREDSPRTTHSEVVVHDDSRSGRAAAVDKQRIAAPVADSTVFSIQDRELDKRLKGIYTLIKAALDEMLHEDDLINGSEPAQFHHRPSARLQATYTNLLGATTSSTVQDVLEANWIVNQLTTAVIGAALHQYVFTGAVVSPLAFGGFLQQRQAMLATDIEQMNAELQSLGSDFDTLMRGTYLRTLGTETFRVDKVAPLGATITKETVNPMLRTHLSCHGRQAASFAVNHEHWDSTIAEAIGQAITLCASSLARGKCTPSACVHWARSSSGRRWRMCGTGGAERISWSRSSRGCSWKGMGGRGRCVKFWGGAREADHADLD